MRIVILGGSGLIGRHLAAELQDAGHEIIITTRQEGNKTREGMEWVRWDGKDAAVLAEIIDGCDAVVNLAGENIGTRLWTGKRKHSILNSRILITHTAAAAVRQAKKRPQVFIQASAIGYYGTGDLPMDENSPNGQDWLAKVGLAWEGGIDSLNDLKIRKVIIRTGVVLTRGPGILQKLALPFRFFVGGPIGNGRQWISWIHIADEARAIRFLIENKHCSGIYNLTAPNPVSNSQMGKAIAARLHRPFWFPIPKFVLRLVLGEMSTLVADGQNVLPRRLLENGFKFRFKTVEEALQNLLP